MGSAIFSLKYRPQRFDEVYVQEVIIQTLKNALRQDKIHNAYLFAGPRGTGKTTTARILAKALNCKKRISEEPCNECDNCKEIARSASIDVLEIDGASNRGIDEIRELREKVKFAPAKSRYKIYIIDEVHMLTKEAFNALLKTLEEPPPYVKFIFATTNPQKLPKTIISRCQRFDFRKATSEEIIERLKFIAKNEKIAITDEALLAIAKRADGAIRDSEVILEQASVYTAKQIEAKDIERLLGAVPEAIILEYLTHLKMGNTKAMLKFLVKCEQSGYDPFEFYKGILDLFRLILLVKNEIPAKSLGISETDYQNLSLTAEIFSNEELTEIIEVVINTERTLKFSTFPEAVLEALTLNLIARFKGKAESGSLTPSYFLQTSPRLAGILKDVSIKESDDNTILLLCDKESPGKIALLESHLSEIESALKKALAKEITVKLAQKEEKKEARKDIVELLDKTFGGCEEVK